MKNHENSSQSVNPPLVSASFEGPSAPGGPLNLNIKMKLQLNHAKNARASLARIIRRYAAGEIDHTQYKGLVYGFSAILPFFKMELESELLKRIEEMEKQLEAVK